MLHFSKTVGWVSFNIRQRDTKLRLTLVNDNITNSNCHKLTKLSHIALVKETKEKMYIVRRTKFFCGFQKTGTKEKRASFLQNLFYILFLKLPTSPN